jgi:hypothetical protein
MNPKNDDDDEEVLSIGLPITDSRRLHGFPLNTNRGYLNEKELKL